jgi:hypothetical protein
MSDFQTALNLARMGYYIHPLVPRDKMPPAGRNGYNNATRDEATIRCQAKMGAARDERSRRYYALCIAGWQRRLEELEVGCGLSQRHVSTQPPLPV